MALECSFRALCKVVHIERKWLYEEEDFETLEQLDTGVFGPGLSHGRLKETGLDITVKVEYCVMEFAEALPLCSLFALVQMSDDDSTNDVFIKSMQAARRVVSLEPRSEQLCRSHMPAL